MEFISKEKIVELSNPGVVSRQLLNPENSSSERVTITEVHLEIGACQPRHTHDASEQIWYARVEEDKVTANNRTYLTADGDRYYKDDSWTGDIVDKMILNQDELDFIKKSEVVFIHFWAGCFEQIIDLKKNNNFRLAVDFVEYRNFKEMEKYAPYIDYFLISGEESILPIFEAFSKKYKGLFNASLADKGSVTYYNGEKYFVPADEALEIVDTTGCGDSYHAGFVCSHMLIGDIYEAMRVGTEFATETLSHYGGF